MSQLQSVTTKRLWQNPQYRQRMISVHKGKPSNNKGRHYQLSEEIRTKKKLRRGEKSGNWKGGISHSYRIKNLATREKPKECEVCKKEKKRICFDHNHQTGRFRGWICINCNSALGLVGDDINILKALIKYLRKDVKSRTL